MRKYNKQHDIKHAQITMTLLGIGIALVISMLLSVGQTSLMLQGRLQEDKSSIYVFGIRAVSVLIANLLCVRASEGKLLPMIGIISIGYLAVLLSLGIIMYDNGFQNFIIGTVSVVAGGLIACLIKLKPQKNRKYRAKSTR